VTNKKDYQEALKNKRAFDNATKRFERISELFSERKTKNKKGKHAKNKKK
jgi:hypothetical protein